MNFKVKTPRDAKYLVWIRTLPCCLCQKPAQSIAHHSETGGMGIKGSDYSAVPLCPVCHDRVHRMIGKNCDSFKHLTKILRASCGKAHDFSRGMKAGQKQTGLILFQQYILDSLLLFVYSSRYENKVDYKQ